MKRILIFSLSILSLFSSSFISNSKNKTLIVRAKEVEKLDKNKTEEVDYSQTIDTSNSNGKNWIFTTYDDYYQTLSEEKKKNYFDSLVYFFKDASFEIINETCINDPSSRMIDCVKINWDSLADRFANPSESEIEIGKDFIDEFKNIYLELSEAFVERLKEFGWISSEETNDENQETEESQKNNESSNDNESKEGN